MSKEFYRTSESSSLMDDRKILDQHHDYVNSLSQTIRRLYASKLPFELYHGPSYTLRGRRDKTTARRVDISHLNRVIHVNPSKQTVLTEPGATMADLLSATIYYGLMPAVVLEFPGITCGSAFATNGSSSSSFRMGAFEDSVKGIEVVLGNGEIVPKATPSGDYADLFWGCAGGMGSLGIITMMEIQLVQAAPYVQLNYTLCELAGLDEATELEISPRGLAEASRRNTRRTSHHSSFSRTSDDEADWKPDFFDAVAFRDGRAILVVGRLVATPDSGVSIHQFSHKSDPYFYSHLSSLAHDLSNFDMTEPLGLGPGPSPYAIHRSKKAEAVALSDYLFRYDRGLFFAGGDRLAKHAHASSPILRSLTSRFFRSSRAIDACKKSGLSEAMTSFVGNVSPGMAGEAVNALGRSLDVWPIWICATKLPKVTAEEASRRFSRGRVEEQYVWRDTQERTVMTVGCFGLGRAKNSAEQAKAVHESKLWTERFMGENCADGKVSLTSAPFSHVAEFARKYDVEWYEALRRRYAAENLPSIIDKVGVIGEFSTQEGKSRPLWTLKAATAVCALCHLD